MPQVRPSHYTVFVFGYIWIGRVWQLIPSTRSVECHFFGFDSHVLMVLHFGLRIHSISFPQDWFTYRCCIMMNVSAVLHFFKLRSNIHLIQPSLIHLYRYRNREGVRRFKLNIPSSSLGLQYQPRQVNSSTCIVIGTGRVYEHSSWIIIIIMIKFGIKVRKCPSSSHHLFFMEAFPLRIASSSRFHELSQHYHRCILHDTAIVVGNAMAWYPTTLFIVNIITRLSVFTTDHDNR